MATLNLFDLLPPSANGSHHVAAPGGYESWNFHAHDPAHNLRLCIGFHDGYILHPNYVRRFNAYRRRPTRNAPPVPAQFPCLVASVYEGRKRVAGSTIQYRVGSFHCTDKTNRLDSNRIDFCAGKIAIELSGQPISGKLELLPTFSLTIEKQFPAVESRAIEHHWLCTPICRASGQIHIASRNVSFDGMGQHNHYYGSGPPSSTARRWMRGQILFPRAAVNFQAADDRTLILASDESGVRQIDDSPMLANWDRHSIWSLPYPSTIDFGRWLILRNPRIAAHSPANLELLYDAYVDGQQTAAWVEIDYPNCLRGFHQAWMMRRRFSTSS